MATHTERVIRIYVCSNPKCENYYGASNMGNLQKQPNIAPSHAKDAGRIRSMRSKCPDCGSERIERFARLVSPIEVAEVKAKVVKEMTKSNVKAQT